MIKRTPIIDKDDQHPQGGRQAGYLDDGMRKRYAYYLVVTNSKRSNGHVLRIAQGRGNQENLIKDLKYGLGLAHVPSGSLAANQAYFVIAALAWNLKTWSASSKGWRVQRGITRRGKSQSPVAWMAERRETDDLKPIDTATGGVVGETPGRNESERIGSLENQKVRRPSPYHVDEGSMAQRRLAEALRHSGGVIATAR